MSDWKSGEKIKFNNELLHDSIPTEYSWVFNDTSDTLTVKINEGSSAYHNKRTRQWVFTESEAVALYELLKNWRQAYFDPSEGVGGAK